MQHCTEQQLNRLRPMGFDGHYVYDALDWIRENKILHGYVYPDGSYDWVLKIKKVNGERAFTHAGFLSHSEALTALLDAILEII